MTRLLEVDDLTIEYTSRTGAVTAVDGVSFELERGERLGLVGESGSGKSTLALSLLGLLGASGRIASGRVLLGDDDLTARGERGFARVRGRHIAMVLQDALSALDPVFTVGSQIAEVVRRHHPGVTRRGARAAAVDMLEQVGLPDPAAAHDRYPHELSGGMRQRVVIARALASEPEILVADEPTTALDVTVQAQILELLEAIAAERHMSVILITHDLGVIAGFAQRMLVMYAGRVVESGAVAEVFARPRHPYTRALLAAVPRVDAASGRLLSIPGSPVDLQAVPCGCAFEPRCAHSIGVCADVRPALVTVAAGRRVACHFEPAASSA